MNKPLRAKVVGVAHKAQNVRGGIAKDFEVLSKKITTGKKKP